MKLHLTILLSWLLISHVFSQERELSVTLDREQILIGEQIQMTVQLKASAADTVTFPAIAGRISPEVEVVERDTLDTNYTGANLEQRVLSQNLIITSFDSGYFAISPLKGTINGDTIESNPFLVSVQTIKIDTAQGIADIKEIQEVPFAWKEWLGQNWHWILLTIAIIAAITWIVFQLSKEREKTPEPEPVIPARPAHEVAFERLDKLLEDELWQNGKIKAYYSELTDILREYIEDRFNIPALEQTTDEIIRSMKHHPDFEKESIDTVYRLLFLADLVKFAKEKPVGSENETHMNSVRSFVEGTIPSTTAEEKHKDQDESLNPSADV